jgi:hypothetical protein
MAYDCGVEGVLAAFGRRPVAGVGLLLVVAWIALVAVESTTAYPWDAGGWYANAAEIAQFAWRGVAGVAALVWLFERAAA